MEEEENKNKLCKSEKYKPLVSIKECKAKLKFITCFCKSKENSEKGHFIFVPCNPRGKTAFIPLSLENLERKEYPVGDIIIREVEGKTYKLVVATSQLSFENTLITINADKRSIIVPWGSIRVDSKLREGDTVYHIRVDNDLCLEHKTIMYKHHLLSLNFLYLNSQLDGYSGYKLSDEVIIQCHGVTTVI